MTLPQRYPTFVDGRIVPPGEACVSTDDLGLLQGLAVFDTLLYERGCRYFEEEHLARLMHGARELSIELSPHIDVRAALDMYCTALGARDAALRIVLTRGVPGLGATLILGARDIVRPQGPGVVVALERNAKRAGDELESIKSTNRLRNVLARERANAHGAYEALLCTAEGDVCEGTISNVFAVVDGGLITPAVDRGCLPGVMRGVLLSVASELALDVRCGRVEVADLARASEIFLSNTTGRVLPVVEVQGVVRGLPGSAGPIAAELRDALHRREERYRRARRTGP